MKCEICDHELNREGDISEDGGLSCPNGHYNYSHSYGHYEEHIDAFGDGHIVLSLGYSYSQYKEVREKMQAARKAFIEFVKELRK